MLPMSPEVVTKQLIETSRIQSFLKRVEIPTEKTVIQPIGELGYVVNPKEPEMKPLEKGSTLVLFDFDDVVYRTTEGVYALMEKTKSYCADHNILLNNEQITTLVRSTESFCSWKDGDPNKEIAHPTSQLMSMHYLLSEVAKSERPNEVLTNGLSTLTRIKKQQGGENTYQEGDPFRFNKRGTLTKLGDKQLWAKELEDAFTESFFGPLPVKETLKVIDALRTQGIEVGIFTTGDPAAQTLRIIEVLQAKNKLPVPHIWLAKGDKGEFIRELMHGGNLEKRPDRTKSTLDAVDTIVMIDDNPTVLDAVVATNGQEEGPTFVGVRYRLAGGYAEEKKWNPIGPNTEIMSPNRLPLEGFLSLIQSIHTQVQQAQHT